MHQICFHKSEFATELEKLTNTFFIFIFRKKKKKAWQQGKLTMKVVEIVENYSQI